MRTSKKGHLLLTAIGIVDKHGLEALTYESLAEASGLSKSGLIYHFPSRRSGRPSSRRRQGPRSRSSTTPPGRAPR